MVLLNRTTVLFAPWLLLACQAPLPRATPAAGHGLERVWIETLGLE